MASYSRKDSPGAECHQGREEESPGCLAKLYKPPHGLSFRINPWKVASRLQLCFSPGPREAAKSDQTGEMTGLTSGPAALTNDVLVPASQWRPWGGTPGNLMSVLPRETLPGSPSPSLFLFWRMPVPLLPLVPLKAPVSPSFSSAPRALPLPPNFLS